MATKKKKPEDEKIRPQNEITLEDFDPLDDESRLLLLQEEKVQIKELFEKYAGEVEEGVEIVRDVEEEERLTAEYKRFEKSNLKQFGGYKEQEGKLKRRFTLLELKELERCAMFMTLQDLADYYQIERESFKRMLERQPEALSVFKKGKAYGNRVVASKLMQKALSGSFFYAHCSTAAPVIWLRLRRRSTWLASSKVNTSISVCKGISAASANSSSASWRVALVTLRSWRSP